MPAQLLRHAILLSSLVASAAGAQDVAAPLSPKFEVFGGFSVLGLSTRLRIDGSVNGTDVGAESDLGLPRTTPQGRIQLRWRPGRRHELEFTGQLVRRSAQATVVRDFTIGDSTYRAGARVRTTLNSDNALLTYRYAISKRENREIGVGVGLGALLLDARVRAVGGASNGRDTVIAGRSVESRLPGPIASFGGYGRFRLGRDWRLDADVRGLTADVDRFGAEVVDAGVQLRWMPFSHWGFQGGGSVAHVAVIVDRDADAGLTKNVSGRVSYTQRVGTMGVVYIP